MALTIDQIEWARKMRSRVGAGKAVAPMLDDRTASLAVGLYDEMKYDGSLIGNGTRINWGGILMRAAVDLWDRIENDPDNAPTLWEIISYKDGVRVIPDQITVGMAFAEGELGWWHVDGRIYRSRNAANVYTPAQHAAGWELVGDDGGDEQEDTGHPDWANLADGYRFAVDTYFIHNGKTYLVLREFTKQSNWAPPALIDNYYKVV